MGGKTGGWLVIIGGAEDKNGDCIILREFVRLAGGKRARLTILSTASEDPAAGADYRRIFLDLGAEEVTVLAVRHRFEADSRHLSTVRDSSGIFFTGGDQLRITGILGGSVLGRSLLQCYRRGAVMAGTSAGASVMSGTMLIGGGSDATPKKEIIRMAPGLGLLQDTVIDQHFAQRGRTGRLLAVVAHNPHILGVGIDEDTAVVVSPRDGFRVTGSGTVTVIDGREITHSNVSESKQDQALALTGVRLHILAPGYGFDLSARQVRTESEKEDHPADENH
jgi:cyanophycinase